MNITPEIPQLSPIRVQARKHALMNKIGQQPARRGWRHAMFATGLAAAVVIGAVWWMSPAPITLTDAAAVDRCQTALGRMRMPWPGPVDVNSVVDRRGDVVLVMLTAPESMWFCMFEGESWTSADKFPRGSSANVGFVAYLGDVIGGKPTGMAYGRVRPDARTATLEAADGRKVPVLLDRGWAVTWWPSAAEAKLVTLYDEAGHVLETFVPENR